MLKFISFVVIAGALAMWSAGETPVSLVGKVERAWHHHATYATSGRSSDWGS